MSNSQLKDDEGLEAQTEQYENPVHVGEVDPARAVRSDWIKRIADDERMRDAVSVREGEVAARKAELVRQSGRRLIDDLRLTVTRDVAAFREEFPGDSTRDISVETTASEGGFSVRKPAPSVVSLVVTPNLEVASLSCQYRFVLSNGLPPREDRFSVTFTGDEAESLRLKHQGTGQVFQTAAALSEFLLVPVLTGRAR